MSQTFKIQAVSKQTKPWTGTYGAMIDYRLKLDGVDEVVVLSKKADSPAPTANDELFGSIDMSGKFGPKFVVDRSRFGGSSGGGSGSKPAYQPKDEKAIQAMWAIGQSVTAYGQLGAKETPQEYSGKVSELAVELFGMVDFVKGSQGEASDSGTDTVNENVPDKQLTVDDIFPDAEEIVPEESF